MHFLNTLCHSLIFLLISWSFSLSAALPGTDEWLKQSEVQLRSWQQELKEWEEKLPEILLIENRINELLALKSDAEGCIDEQVMVQTVLDEKLHALGAKKDGPEAKSLDSIQPVSQLSEIKSNIVADKNAAELSITQCRLLVVNTRVLYKQLKEIRSKVLSKSLVQRDIPVWDILLQDSDIFPENYLITSLKSEKMASALLFSFIVFFLLFPVAKYASVLMQAQVNERLETIGLKTQRMLTLISGRLTWMALLISLLVFFYVSAWSLAFAIGLALLISLVLAPLLEMVVCSSSSDCPQGMLFRLLMDILLIGVASLVIGLSTSLPANLFVLLNASYLVILMLVSLILFRVLNRQGWSQHLGAFRVPLFIVMALGPVSYIIGYRSFGEMVSIGVYGSLLGWLIMIKLNHIGRYAFAMLEPDTQESNAKIREIFGYKEAEIISGLWLGRLLFTLGVALLLIYWLLYVWQVPQSDIHAIQSYFFKGIEIGSLSITPSKILTGIITLTLLIIVVRWLRQRLADKWLEKTRFDAGAKESIVSLSSYFLFAVAVIFALSIAGVEFQNLAIIAGALSVGIGFGLQNIVSNFISGLILLFERPVKPGDWVVVGSTEGYIKKISIRYTLIQTFDRADVMVPNSQLISNEVTNWMLRDTIGRLIVPVGVAYGSDTERVKDILLEICRAHSSVLTHDYRCPQPTVLFMGFGDSSLNFELRCFLRVVDTKLRVRSDLLFEIDKAFRKEGIEIPFPQRVVHLQKDDE